MELQVAWEAHVAHEPAWFESLVALHREPHRRYHTERHVRGVIRHALALGHHATDLGAVVAAAFFHDAVYDPTAADNEARSADLARRALADLGWQADRVAAVAAMIEATAEHTTDRAADTASIDTAVLLAADLGVLAADPAGYAEYVTGVRSEYGFVSDADWRSGRGQVLRGLLDRAAIYDIRLGLEAWERRARANLAAELTTLAR